MTGAIRRLRTMVHMLRADRRGAAAVEFAIILPLMLVLFFGTLELSNGVAVDRKVTLAARTLSDLTSQVSSVSSTNFSNAYLAATQIMAPYSAALPGSSPMSAIISEIKIDSSGKATVAWSVAANATAHTTGMSWTALPSALAVPNTYLILGEASYTYTPVVGYVLKSALAMGDQFYTRPRQSSCVLYGTTTCP